MKTIALSKTSIIEVSDETYEKIESDEELKGVIEKSKDIVGMFERFSYEDWKAIVTFPEVLNNIYTTIRHSNQDKLASYHLPFSFFRPTSPYYTLSLRAKVLYGIMNQMNYLCYSNGWNQDNYKAYIPISQLSLHKALNCSREEGDEAYRELHKAGLIEITSKFNDGNYVATFNSAYKKEGEENYVYDLIEEIYGIPEEKPNSTKKGKKSKDTK